ncbi:MAG: hypothetical protein ACREM6_10700, partial [Vulcanimicrobiaceae bacterium]
MATILFVHAAAVSLDATIAALNAGSTGLDARHELIAGLVDPAAVAFAGDDADFGRIRAAVRSVLRGDERRVVLSCSVYNGLAPRLTSDLGIPVERSDDAGVVAALARGRRVGLAVSYPPSYGVIAEHLAAAAGAQPAAI